MKVLRKTIYFKLHFLGRGTAPPQTPPLGEGAHPPPQTSPPLAAFGGSASRLRRLGAPTLLYAAKGSACYARALSPLVTINKLYCFIFTELKQFVEFIHLSDIC